MLPVIIHLLETLRRALKRGSRHLFLLADVLAEAMRDWRASAEKHPYVE
jgi:hypothetical protein